MSSKVRTTMLFLSLCLFLAATLHSALSAVDAEKIARIKKAVTDSLCYDVYWAGGWGHGEDYRRGVPLPFKLLIEGEKFYARVDPIGFVGKYRQPMMADRIGFDRGDRAVVVTNYEPDVDRKFLTGSLIEDTLTIPTDCTPRYDPPTPQKERMLQTVVNTMQRELSWLVREGIANYPNEVTLIIADFNVDYPSTYLLVEPPGNLYTVTLHDPEHYESDKYERGGQYPSRNIQIKPHLKPLLAKIRKHGIIRKIVLTP